jgi:galactoside O-acetyltransferase
MFGKVGRGVKVAQDLVVMGGKNVEIGDNVRIDTGVLIMAAAPGAYLRLENHIHVAARAIFACGGGIEIESFATVGYGSKLISASDTFDGSCLVGPCFPERLTKVKRSKIRIGQHAIVTTDCTLLPGAFLMEGTVLGAMSMLKGTTGLWEFYAGIPARNIGGMRCTDAFQLGIEFEREWDKGHQ